MSREKLTENTEIVPDMGHLFVTNLFSIKSINKGKPGTQYKAKRG